MTELSWDLARSPHAAVVVTGGDILLHAGLVYRDTGGSPHVLHLAQHEALLQTDRLDGWAFASPAIDPEELKVLAGFCSIRADLGRVVPYGFRRKGSVLQEGVLVLGAGVIGLTCATFVMVMFDWAKIALLADDTWDERDDMRKEEDRQVQEALVASMRARGTPTEHVEALAAEVGCLRFRVEEVAAASGIEARPVTFRAAATAGTLLLQAFRSV